jgi:hypothetical protein
VGEQYYPFPPYRVLLTLPLPRVSPTLLAPGAAVPRSLPVLVLQQYQPCLLEGCPYLPRLIGSEVHSEGRLVQGLVGTPNGQECRGRHAPIPDQGRPGLLTGNCHHLRWSAYSAVLLHLPVRMRHHVGIAAEEDVNPWGL